MITGHAASNACPRGQWSSAPMKISDYRRFRTPVGEDDLTGNETVVRTGEPADEFANPLWSPRKATERLRRGGLDGGAYVVAREAPGGRGRVDDAGCDGVKGNAGSGPFGCWGNPAHPTIQRTLGDAIGTRGTTKGWLRVDVGNGGSFVAIEACLQHALVRGRQRRGRRHGHGSRRLALRQQRSQPFERRDSTEVVGLEEPGLAAPGDGEHCVDGPALGHLVD